MYTLRYNLEDIVIWVIEERCSDKGEVYEDNRMAAETRLQIFNSKFNELILWICPCQNEVQWSVNDFWSCQSCTYKMTYSLLYIISILAAIIENERERDAPCPIVTISVNVASLIIGHISWVIYVALDYRPLYMMSWQPLEANKQEMFPRQPPRQSYHALHWNLQLTVGVSGSQSNWSKHSLLTVTATLRFDSPWFKAKYCWHTVDAECQDLAGSVSLVLCPMKAVNTVIM